jgi:hypothetical protein
MDIADLTKAPREVVIAGKTFSVRPFEFREWGELQAFVKDHGDDPVTRALRSLDNAERKGIRVAAETRNELLREAKLEAINWPPQVMTSAWFKEVSEIPGGAVEFLWKALKTTWPQAPEHLARELEDKMTAEESAALLEAAIGLVRRPKAETPAATPQRRQRGKRRKTSGSSPTTGANTSTL